MNTFTIEITTTEILGDTVLYFTEWVITENGKQSVKNIRHEIESPLSLVKIIDLYKRNYTIENVSYKIITSAGNIISKMNFK